MVFWILVGILIVIGIYILNNHYFNYWSRRGIPQQQSPTFFLGILGELLNKKHSFGQYFQKIYLKYKNQRLHGFYFSYRPALAINDPILVQEVLIKNFTSFHDRVSATDYKIDPLNKHLFLATGQTWRDLRVKMTPTFTSGKLKGMYPTIHNSAQVLQDFLIKNVKNGNDTFDIRDLMARFTTNVISSVAFGIENDAINEPENIFRKMGVKIFQKSFKSIVGDTIYFFAPNLLKFFNIKLKRISKELEDFFTSIVRQTIDYREKHKEYERKDFMELLIQLKNQGYVSVDKDDFSADRVEHSNEAKKLTLMEVAAQAFIFFIAGFETSSSTATFCLFELSRNPQMQKKVQEEIDRVLKASESSEITYENLNEMKYLECCVDEALRKYPILPVLFRECTDNHTFTGTNWTVEKGTQIFIPVLGFHRDPEIFENPLEFKPERFIDSSTGNGKSKGLFYLPFGDGPRNCIGARMGKLQTKLALAMVLSKFTFELADKSLMSMELEFDSSQLVLLMPKQNLMLKVISRT